MSEGDPFVAERAGWGWPSWRAIAGILAFVDIGDAKAANCGPVLAGATAQAQRTKGGAPRDDVGRGTTAKSESGKSNTSEKTSQDKKFLGIF